MITGINESKTLTKLISSISLIVKNVTRIKSGITINVGVIVKIQKNIVCVNKIIFGILLHVAVKMVNM